MITQASPQSDTARFPWRTALLHLDRVKNIQISAQGAQIHVDFPGADADHESAYVQLVQGLVADTLLKHHLGLHGSGAGEHHIAGANVEGGGRTLQAGEVTFQVANAPALRGFLQLSSVMSSTMSGSWPR